MDWARDGRDWPHHAHSRFVLNEGRRWHVQQWPAPSARAPQWLLLHGTGASTHSWRRLVPLLAARAGVVAVDLPGHGFSDAAHGDGATLPGMARGVAALLREIGVQRLFAWRADDDVRVRRLVASTGSRIDEEGIALYRRLVSDPAHVAGALAMMANWDLQALAEALPRLHVPLHLLAAESDLTVPPAQARRVAGVLPQTSLRLLPGLGHLAHEEDPQRVFDAIALLLGLSR